MTSIVAALDVRSGQTRAEEIARNDAEHFIEFLTSIDALIDPALAVHLIVDNGSSHVAKRTKAWLAEHFRFQVQHTPKHASWLNQVAFGVFHHGPQAFEKRQVRKRDDVVAKIMTWIANYDCSATPFAWTYNGKPLKAA